MLNLGRVRPGATIYIPFDTFDGGTGASITMTGLAVTDIEVYKDGSVTQRASDAGYTLLDTDGIDFDGLTGIHGFSITLADNTTAGFWAAGSRYFVVVSAITVDAQTVSFVAACFEIGMDGATLDTTIATLSSQTSFTLTNGPAEDDALNGCVVYIHDVASAVQGGFAVISDYTGSTKTVTLTAGVTFTAAATDNISIFPPANTSWLGGTAQTGNDVGLDVNDILTDTGTTLQAELDGIQADTEDIQARLPAALVSGRIDATVDGTGMEAAAAAVIVDAWEAQSQADPTGFHVNVMEIGGTAQTANDNGADINAILVDTAEIGAAGAGLTALATQASVNTIDGIVDSILVDTAEIGAAGAGLTALATAAALTTLTTRLNGTVMAQGTIGATGNDTTHLHLSGLTYGDDEINNSLLVIFDVSNSEYHARWVEDWADTGDLATVATLPFTPQASTDTYWLLPIRQDVTGGSGLDAAGVRAAVGLASANLDTQLGAIDDFLDTEVAAILADTNELQTDWANGGRLDLILDARASQTSVDTIDGIVDAILVDTSTTLQGDLDTLLAGAASVSGTADSGTTTTCVDAARTEADTDYWKGSYIYFKTGTIAGQCRLITAFTPASDTITFAPATTQAVSTNDYDIIPGGRVDIELWDGSAVNALQSGRVDSYLGAGASGVIDATLMNVTGSEFTAIPWNAAWDAEVQSEVQDAIEANHLDHLLAATYDPASKPGAADALLNELVESDAGVARFTANSLEQAPTGAGGDGSAFVAIPWNAAWDAEVQSEVADALAVYDPPTNTEMEARTLVAASYATASALDAVDNFLDTEIAAILADTNELQTDWANGGRLDLILDARASQTSVDTIDGIVDSILADTGTDGVVVNAAGLATDAVTEIANGVLDLANAVETGLTMRQALRLVAAALAGKISGAATTTVAIRNAVADSKARITATVDADGNRSAVTTDVT